MMLHASVPLFQHDSISFVTSSGFKLTFAVVTFQISIESELTMQQTTPIKKPIFFKVFKMDS
ncbi:MAG: hypothetical protein ACJAR3_001226 [Roseivirga sp.]|jgi:hypothetical protein